MATALVLIAVAAGAETATPNASPSASGVTATPTPGASRALALSPTLAATSPRHGISPSPVGVPTGTPVAIGDAAPQEPEPASRNGAVLAPAAPAARAFRTPERAGAPAFVAPRAVAPEAPAADAEGGGGMPAVAPMRPARSGTRTVVFHAVARTALEGFDLFVTYPRTAGDFVGSGDQVDCTTSGSGMLIGNDRDDGTMRLIVASAQTVSFPLDITCRFAVTAGAGIDRGDIGVRVGEVTSNGARGDASLLSVGVEVR